MNTAYLMGRATFNEGRSLNANPYSKGTTRHTDWWIGYRSAESDWLDEIN